MLLIATYIVFVHAYGLTCVVCVRDGAAVSVFWKLPGKRVYCFLFHVQISPVSILAHFSRHEAACFTALACPGTELELLKDGELQKRTESLGMKGRGMEEGPQRRARDAWITGSQ